MLDRRQLMTGVVASLLGSLVLPRRSAAQQTGLLALTDRLVLVTIRAGCEQRPSSDPFAKVRDATLAHRAKHGCGAWPYGNGRCSA